MSWGAWPHTTRGETSVPGGVTTYKYFSRLDLALLFSVWVVYMPVIVCLSCCLLHLDQCCGIPSRKASTKQCDERE